MEINRENFEAYLLDQMEGRLSACLQDELRQFLAKNPDCAVISELNENIVLHREQQNFPDKDSLKKRIPDSRTTLTVNNFDLFSIARMEGDLSGEQVTGHTQMMENHPRLKSEWDRWQQTRLNSSDILYPGKAGLKKRVPVSGNIRWLAILSAAASIALVVILMATRERYDRVTASDQSFRLPLIEEDKVGIPVSPPLKNQLFTPIADSDPGNLRVVPDARDVPESEKVVAVSLPSQEFEGNGAGFSARPLRAALAANTIPAPVAQGMYDRIRPLQLPDTPVHMSGVSLSRLAEMDLQEVVEIYAEEKDISIWTIANAGIKGINRITGADISLFAARDNEGEISGFQLKSKRLNITTPIENED